MTAMTSQARSVLTQLLEACEAGDGYVVALRFRADHGDDLTLLDQLVRQQYIVAEREKYRAGVIALAQLDSRRATDLMEQSEWLWEGLRSHYKNHLTKLIPLSDLALASGLGVGAVQHTLTYMLDVPWSSGHSGGDGQLLQSIAATEAVLRYSTFAALIDEARSWADANATFGVFPSQLTGCEVAADDEPAGPLQGGQTLPEWLPRLPPDAQALMRELHVANAARLPALTAMGIRAVLDVVCLDKLGGDTGGFAVKMKALLNAGHLTEVQHAALMAVVDAGSAAAHRGYIPDPRSVKAMLSALDHMLLSLYVLKDVASELGRVTPKRTTGGRMTTAVPIEDGLGSGFPVSQASPKPSD